MAIMHFKVFVEQQQCGFKTLKYCFNDIILIDSPPFLSLITDNILTYIESVLIPISPEFLSYKSFSIFFANFFANFS